MACRLFGRIFRRVRIGLLLLWGTGIEELQERSNIEAQEIGDQDDNDAARTAQRQFGPGARTARSSTFSLSSRPSHSMFLLPLWIELRILI